jgi:hypothetical protein
MKLHLTKHLNLWMNLLKAQMVLANTISLEMETTPISKKLYAWQLDALPTLS